jgi:hypothetical protein
LEARTRGPQAVRYGVFGFRPAGVLSNTAYVDAPLKADRPESGGQVGFTVGAAR